MNTMTRLSKDTAETIQYGEELSRLLKKGDIVCLFGELGSGKTTFVKGLAKGLRVSPNKVHSPTFVLMNAYEGKIPLFHFDFYRIEKSSELSSIGYDEFLYDEGIAVVEWAEHFGALMPKEYLKIRFQHKGENKREIKISAHGKKYRPLLEKL